MEEAAQCLLNAAGQGDAEAQYRLGLMLQMGRETLQLLRLAALIEIPLPDEWEKAQQILYREALTWFAKAATQGHSHAQKDIALLHIGGLGVPQNSSEGLRWLRKAVEADSANSDAQFFMGQAYLKGWGVESNAAEAAWWFTKAANAGHSYAQGLLAELYEGGDGVTRNFQEALRLYHEAAAQDHPHSLFRLGCIYAEGAEIERDYAEARKWFECTSQNGYGEEKVHAHLRLGSFYERGLGVERDYATAATWYRSAHREATMFCKEVVPLTKAAVTRITKLLA